MKIAVLGFAREGQSVLRYIKKNKRYKNAPALRSSTGAKDGKIWILDKNPNIKVPKGVKSHLGASYLDHLDEFQTVFRSPGIPYNLPELKRARRAGVHVSSNIKLFFEEAVKRTPHVIGVTGTKGKGTTATLIYNILKAAKRQVFLVGNVGNPALDILPKLSRRSWVVLELSSFQLQDTTISPPVAVVLDIFPEHLDLHANVREYYAAKANVGRFQKPSDSIFFFARNAKSKWLAEKSRARKIGVDETRFSLFSPEFLHIPGKHNFKNAAMAATVALQLGVKKEAILRAVGKFRGLEHRLELVRTIRVNLRDNPHESTASIAFYNDSLATNPESSAAAVNAFPNDEKIVILGGADKNLNYAPLARALAKNRNDIPLVILLGENRNKIARAISGIRNKELRIMMVGDLETAVMAAYQFARKLLTHNSSFIIHNSISIILSPGATSFDMFKNYADRGAQFKKLVRKLPR